jgi:hypothetical protein
MKLGLLTDIHEQVDLLQIALDRFGQEQVDRSVVIGDVFETGERIEESRMRCSRSLVVGRYSVLPFYNELERDLQINGSRLVKWRFFYLKEQRLSYGYYWSLADCLDDAQLKPEGLALADRLATIAAKRTSFFTLDIAETEDGDWILVEINDGQMAVPSENDLDELYGNLRTHLRDMT